ncbi:MAG: ATP-dependent helicase [Bacteroidetes bacterium]|nr:MAG: ATP-dependent helicase [Bacteroidota bacterium]
MKFSDLKITRQYLNAIDDLGFTEVTPVQQKAIPPILAGQDVVAVAQTGTGKTAAYMLPVLKRLNYAQGESIRSLILVPTKELVLQVEEMSRALAKYTDLRITAIYGGIGWKAQAEKITSGIDVLIATPGRFKELYYKGVIDTKKIQILVLDEADKMMDMGFINQLRDILEVIPVKRQNLLFSATFNQKVEELSHEFLEFPTRVEIAETATIADDIEQYSYELTNERSKIEFLKELLSDEEEFTRVLVFVRSKNTVENIAKYVARKTETEIRTLHSNKGQNTRINSMQAFKDGEVRILIATDVASRGIDVTGVSHVINFDVPRNYEDYVHRIGRTGRAKMSGIAISFVNKAERYHIKNIEKLIRIPIERKVLPFEIPEFPTLKGENKEMELEIDFQKRKENPDYKGAFHERTKGSKKSKKGKRRR